MSTAAGLLGQAQALGAKIWVEGTELKLDIPNDFPDTLLQSLRENKMEVLIFLYNAATEKQSDRASVDELENMLKLGTKLRNGEISAIKCGITGQRCIACQGIPCLGSEPWMGN